jgi:hypothetical protein
VTVYVGDTVSEIFPTGVVGETFTRIASFIDNVAITWSPTFTDLTGGGYRYTYVTTAAGPHEWFGTGSATGIFAINFDVDGAPPTTITIVTSLPTVSPAARGGGTVEQRFPIRFDLDGEWAIVQGAEWTWPMRLMVDALPAPPFVISTPYVVGNYLVPPVGSETGFTYLVVTAGTAGGSNPTWPVVMGGRVTSGGAVFMAIDGQRLLDTSAYNAEMRVRTDPDGTVSLLATVASGRIAVGYDPPKWTVNTVKALGNQVVPTVLNGWVYEAVVAGTTHAATQPTWPTTPGAVVTDGTVTWRNVSTDAGVTNFRIALPASYTDGLTDWGVGLYDIELYDAFGSITRLAEGVAVLSRDIT